MHRSRLFLLWGVIIARLRGAAQGRQSMDGQNQAVDSSSGGQNIQYPRYKPTYNNEVNNNIVPNPIYVEPLPAPPIQQIDTHHICQ